MTDFRYAQFPFTGLIEHRLRAQAGLGTVIKISWNLPTGVTGRLQDIVVGSIIDVSMSDTGSYINTDPATFDQLKMTINYNNITGIEETSSIPAEFSLYQNYPNPFNPSTSIRFSLKNASGIMLKVYNVQGVELSTLANGYYQEGDHVVNFESTGLPTGVYFYRLITGQKILTQKMVLLR